MVMKAMKKGNCGMNEIEILLTRYPALEQCRTQIEAAAETLIDTYRQGGKLMVCGNGGSCADSAHIVGELMKAFARPRGLAEAQRAALRNVGPEGAAMAQALQQGLPAIDLTAQAGLNTAFLNDVDPALCFAQQAFVYAQPGDILMGLSTSGNSDNVIKAGIAAKAKGAHLIGLTGERECRMDGLFDTVIHVPARKTYQVQEYHLPVYHALCLAVEQAFFGED